jgi:hypothetical protein
MSTVVALLKNVRTLVGDAAFNEAVAELSGSVGGAGEVAKKPRKASAVDPEKSAKRRAEMGALQNFIKTVRAEQPAETPYKDVQKLAGERWKTMDAKAREAYAVAEAAADAVAEAAAPAAGGGAPAKKVTKKKD